MIKLTKGKVTAIICGVFPLLAFVCSEASVRM